MQKVVEEDQQQDEYQNVEEDTELCLRVEVEREETCREYGYEKAYEGFTARYTCNVDAFRRVASCPDAGAYRAER